MPSLVFEQVARQFRKPVNELDKTTIVSIFPKEVSEFKSGLSPGSFTIPAAKEKDKFEILVVGSSSWWKEMEQNQPWLEIVTGSHEMARSVINDWTQGLLGCDMATKMPGLFYIPGEFTKKSIEGYVSRDGKPFRALMEAAKVKQDNWFKELVMIADTMWARTNGNPQVIDDNARLAAEHLNLAPDKPWMQDFKTMSLVNCKSCGNLINPNYPICANCKNPISGIIPQVAASIVSK